MRNSKILFNSFDTTECNKDYRRYKQNCQYKFYETNKIYAVKESRNHNLISELEFFSRETKTGPL